MKRTSLICLSAYLLSACTNMSADDSERATFIYQPAGIMLPFPSDRYLEKASSSRSEIDETASGYRIRVEDYLETDPALNRFPGVPEGLAAADGFGTSAELAVALTASADLGDLTDEDKAPAASVAAGSPVQLISIQSGDADAGKPLPFVARVETDGKTLFFRPWKPLRGNGWYALVFHRSLRDVAGSPYRSPSGFESDYQDAQGEGLSGEGYKRLATVIKTTPVFAVTFRTASVRTKLEKILTEVRSSAPQAPTYTTHNPSGNQPDVSKIIEGYFTAVNYRDDGGWLHAKSLGAVTLRFTLTIPKVTAEHAEPFGVVVGQHGLGNVRQVVLDLANEYAKHGLATVSIDAPGHGNRGPGEGKTYEALDQAREVLGVWTDGEHVTFNTWQFRDIIRHQVVDHLQLVRMLQAFPLDVTRTDNTAGADLDVSSPGYTGQSMGGIIGGISGGELNELGRVVLNVPGARISNILVRNEVLGAALIAVLAPPAITQADAYRMVAMAQAVLDPGDPINYVELIATAPKTGMAARPLLMQASLHDGTLPNFATFDMARAAGAKFVGPWKLKISGLPDISIGESGIEALDSRVLALYRDIQVNGEATEATHGNLWGSDTALPLAASFLLTGVIPAP